MTDYIWPPSLRQSSVDWRFVSNTEAFEAQFSGMYQTVSRPGDRLACTVRVENARLDERRRLRTLATRLRGSANRVLLTEVGRALGGAFPVNELIANCEFANGTTGFAAGSEAAISAIEGGVRCKRTSNPGSSGVNHYFSQALGTTVQNRVYVFRHHVGAVRGTVNCRVTPSGNVSIIGLDAASAIPAYLRGSFQATSTSGVTGYFDNIQPGNSLAGDYFDVDFASCAPGFLVDGRENLLTYSRAQDNADWTKGNATTSTGGTAPDGSVTACAVIENSSAGQHFVTQSKTRASAAEDLVIYGHFKRGAGTRNIRLFVGSSGANYGHACFDLSNGTVLATALVGTATNARTYVESDGNGYYFCALIVRVAASTTLFSQFDLNNGTTDSYTGDGSSSVYFWDVGAGRGSVPTRGRTTTSAAVPGDSQIGSTIYVKGGPTSLPAALRAGDPIEFNGQLTFLSADLDFDAAGLGVLQVAPAIAAYAADNAPIVVRQPLCKMLIVGEAREQIRPGQLSDFEFDFMQDLSQ